MSRVGDKRKGEEGILPGLHFQQYFFQQIRSELRTEYPSFGEKLLQWIDRLVTILRQIVGGWNLIFSASQVSGHTPPTTSKISIWAKAISSSPSVKLSNSLEATHLMRNLKRKGKVEIVNSLLSGSLSELKEKRIFTDILAGFTINNRVLRLPAIVLLNTTFRKLGRIPEEGPSFRVKTSCSKKTIAGRWRTLL